MAAKCETSSSKKANRDVLLEIEAKVRKCWEDKKVLSSKKPGHKFFEKFPYNCFMGHPFSLSKLDSWLPDFPIDAMRFALAYVCDGPVDAAKINFLHSNADSVFDAAYDAIISLTKEMSWHEEFLAADFEYCLRTGPPSTSADKVFANDINIALNKTKQHYEACQFREALESGFLALQDARDWYKSLCGGTNAMNRDLVWRFMEMQTRLVAPICPHYSEYVWRELLHNVNFVVKADWPAADAPENSTLHSIHKYLKSMTDSLKKQIESERTKKVCPNIEVLIYVKEESFTLKMREDGEVELGAQALDFKLPFREFRVLLQNLDLIKRQIGVERVQVLSATNPHDLAKAGSHVELIKTLRPIPGKPISLILKRSRILTSITQLKPSSFGCSPMRSNTTMSKPKCSDKKAKQKHGVRDLPNQVASKCSNEDIQVLEWFDKQSKQRHGIGETMNQFSTSTRDNKSRDDLHSYPPCKLRFKGSFDKAMDAACDQDKWLLVNLQCREDLSSHKLNRDTWADKAISQIISTNFIFWQEYSDWPEGTMVSSNYKLDSRTVVIIIDPVTGQALRSWNGMVQPDDLLLDLLPFLDSSPRNMHVAKEEEEQLRRALEASVESMKFETFGRTSKEYLVPSFNTRPMTNKATEIDEEEELQRALEASMESIKFETSNASTSKEALVPSFNTSPISTRVSEEEEERQHTLEAFVERMKLETSTASTSKGDAVSSLSSSSRNTYVTRPEEEEEELRRALAASMESDGGSTSEEDPLGIFNIKPIITYVTEDDEEESRCAMADFMNSFETSSASTSKVPTFNNATREEEDEELQRALVTSLESLKSETSSASTSKVSKNTYVTKEEDDDELLHALEVESMKWGTSGSTSKEDLVPFSNSSSMYTDVTRDEDEELCRALAASMESFKVETWTRGRSSKERVD
ncbi:uncharacterized protein LOC133708008 [Rosa rugosa]|uniref:uncharacterized protein LOC133708008 n=1 Tax=Rosa rugosa TaxID=74645 RepID=UPI002B4122DE|nr:uncharacterized protein LOC133708008 [Rosa rugosa]